MLNISPQAIAFLLQQKKSDALSIFRFFQSLCDGEIIENNKVKFSICGLEEKQKDQINFALFFFSQQNLGDFEKNGDEIIFAFKENSDTEFHPFRGATKQTYIIYNITNNEFKNTSTDSTLKVERKKAALQNTEQHHVDVCDHFNKVCGTRYKPDSVAFRKLVNAKLNAGYSVEQIKKVIDVKAHDWLNNDKMSKYLRPKTLFGNNFESYVNDPRILRGEKLGESANYLKNLMEA